MRGEFYKMDFRAWNHGTVDLTLEQEAAYLRLCHAMYDVSGPVPNSTRFLQSLLRCGNVKAQALVQQLIKAGKIIVTADGRLTNKRVEEELAEREEVSSLRRAAGEKGGRSKRPRPAETARKLPVTPECSRGDGRVLPECSPSAPGVTVECPPSDGRVTVSNSLKTNNTTEALASKPGSRGDKIRGEHSSAHDTSRAENDRLEAALREAAGLENDPSPGLLSLAPIHGLIAEGFDFEKHILPVVRTKRGKRFSSWAYVVEAVREKADGRRRVAAAAPPAYRPPPDPDAYLAGLSDDRWRDAIRHWQKTCGAWDLSRHTPPPDNPRTKVPRRFLDEFEVKQFAPVTRLVTIGEQLRGAA